MCFHIQVFMNIISEAGTILISGSAHHLVISNIYAKIFNFFLLVQKIMSGQDILKLIQNDYDWERSNLYSAHRLIWPIFLPRSFNLFHRFNRYRPDTKLLTDVQTDDHEIFSSLLLLSLLFVLYENFRSMYLA
jgi:hypothetical protein